MGQTLTMGSFSNFEDIKAWQKARTLAKEISDLIKTASWKHQFHLRDQMLRSSGSIMDNIAEGFDRGGKKEFIHFLTISKGSASELRSQLYRAWDHDLITSGQMERLAEDSKEISKMIQGLINYLLQSEYSGTKFKV